MNQIIVEGIRRIQPLPEGVVRLCTVMADPKHSTREITMVVRGDPALLAKVSELGRSAAVAGVSGTTQTVESTVARLGERRLHALVLGLSTQMMRDAELSGYELEPMALFARSTRMAVASQLLADRMRYRNEPLAYTAGLLADIGKLVMDQVMSDASEEMDASIDAWDARERTVFGLDHAEVSAQLCKRWGFPDDMVEAVRNHHVGGDDPLARILNLADAVVGLMGVGLGRDGLNYGLALQGLKEAGLSQRDLALLMLNVEDGAAAIEAALGKE